MNFELYLKRFIAGYCICLTKNEWSIHLLLWIISRSSNSISVISRWSKLVQTNQSVSSILTQSDPDSKVHKNTLIQPRSTFVRDFGLWTERNRHWPIKLSIPISISTVLWNVFMHLIKESFSLVYVWVTFMPCKSVSQA